MAFPCPLLSTMAPKARPAAKGKAKAKAVVVRPMREDRGRVGALRRPAGAPPGGGAPGALTRWSAGEEVRVSEIPIEHVGVGTMVEVTDGSYFGSPCKAAGQLQSIDVQMDSAIRIL